MTRKWSVPRVVRFAGAVLMALALFAPVGALSVEPDEVLADAALETRARKLSAELRCLVCQNESIDESRAPLARDLRLLVRERLKAGDSDAEIRAFVVDRYGEFVLLRPRFGWHTLLLWLTPLAVLLLGGAAAWRVTRRRRTGAGSGLTADEETKLKALLESEPGEGPAGGPR